jgi:hypothetical protein
MKRSRTVLVLAAACFSIWAFIQLAYPNYSHRFRLTIEVETPEGSRAASSVMESVLVDNGYLPTPGRRFNLNFKGEAVFVDLGQGQNLVGTLRFAKGNDDGMTMLALKAWGLAGSQKDWSTISAATGSKILAGDLIPYLVSFTDLNDPKTVRMVRPEEFADVFGPGIRLAKVSLEITEAPVTSFIESKLPWVSRLKGTLGGQVQRDLERPERNLTANDFKRG